MNEKDVVIARVKAHSRAYVPLGFWRTVLNLAIAPKAHPWKPNATRSWKLAVPLGMAIVFLLLAFFSNGCVSSPPPPEDPRPGRREAVLGLSPAELAVCDTGHLEHVVNIPEDGLQQIFLAVRIPAALGPVKISVSPGEGTSLDGAAISATFDPPLDAPKTIALRPSEPISIPVTKDRIIEIRIRPPEQDESAWARNCAARAGNTACAIRVEAQGAFGGQKELEKILAGAVRVLEDADRYLADQSSRPVPSGGTFFADVDYELRPDGPCGSAIPTELAPAVEAAATAIHEARIDMYGSDAPVPFDPAKVEKALGALDRVIRESPAISAAAETAKWRGLAGLPATAAHLRAMKSMRNVIARESWRDAAFWVAIAGSKSEAKYRAWFRHAPPLTTLSDAITRIAFAAALGARPTATVIVGERPWTVQLPANGFKITSGLCYGKGSNIPVPDQNAAAERAAQLTIGGRTLMIDSLDGALRAASAADRASGVLCELDFDASKLRSDLEARVAGGQLDELRTDLERLDEAVHFANAAGDRHPMGQKVGELVRRLPSMLLRPAVLEKRAASIDELVRTIQATQQIARLAGLSDTEWKAALTDAFSSNDFLERALSKRADAGLGALRADLITLDAAVGYRKLGSTRDVTGEAVAGQVDRALCSIFSEAGLAKRIKKISDYETFVGGGRDILNMAPSDELSCGKSRIPLGEIRPRMRAAYQSALAQMKLSPLQLAAAVRRESGLVEPHVAEVVESDPLLFDAWPPFGLPKTAIRTYFDTCNEKFCEELDSIRGKLPENSPEVAFETCPKESNEGRLLNMELPPVGTEIAESRRCPSKDWVELTRLTGSGPALLLSSPENFTVGTDSARKRTHMQHGSVYTLVIALDDRASVGANKILLVSTAHGQRFWVSTLRVGEMARGNN